MSDTLPTSIPTALRGVATVRLSAEDLDAAGAWYAEILGVEPYFKRPGYIEFRFGDDSVELGIVDRRFLVELGDHGNTSGAAGAVVYWCVDDVEAAMAGFLGKGAVMHESIRAFGDGFVAGSVVDPFGNVVGLMVNQHYRDVRAGLT
ncbi:putative enzyme related to lactoylglutathione lyase [Sphingomonas sp. UYAg733]